MVRRLHDQGAWGRARAPRAARVALRGAAGPGRQDEVARRRKALREAVAADPEWEVCPYPSPHRRILRSASVVRASRLRARGVRADTAGRAQAINGADESQLMQYNDPFVPPWRRRNEVAIGVQRRAPAAQ